MKKEEKIIGFSAIVFCWLFGYLLQDRLLFILGIMALISMVILLIFDKNKVERIEQ